MRTEAKIALFLFTTRGATVKKALVLQILLAEGILAPVQVVRIEKFFDRLCAAS